MRIRNKITGIESTERADIARALIRQGMCEEVPRDPSISIQDENRANLCAEIGAAKIPAPEWSVRMLDANDASNQGGRLLVIEMKLGGATFRFAAPPDRANARREWDGGGVYLSGFGRAVPDSILKSYTRQWNENPEQRGQSLKTVLDGRGVNI